MVHIDSNANPCTAQVRRDGKPALCGSTRAQYTMANRGAAQVTYRCLSCKYVYRVDAAADVAREIAPSLEKTRHWWSLV